MATLSRPTFVVWTDPKSGKRVPANTPGAKKEKRKAAKYYGRGIPGLPPRKRVPLSADKRTAEVMLAALVSRAERGAVGLPDKANLATPVAEMIERYAVWMGQQGASAKHVKMTRGRIDRAAVAAGWLTIADITLPGAKLKLETAARGIDGLSRQTADMYIRDVTGWANWMHTEAEVLTSPPFPRGRRRRGKASRPKPVFRRRPPTPDELARIVAVAESSPHTFRDLDGQSRAALYLVAAGSGLRAQELSRLTVGQCDVTSDPPTLRVTDESDKAGRGATLPLPPGPAAALARQIDGRDRAEQVWPGGWWDNAAEMLREDMEVARVAVVADTAEGPARLDFHSLRHFYSTQLVASGASVKVAQSLLRHSTPALTIGKYAHAADAEKAAAVNKIPALGIGTQPVIPTDAETLARLLIVVASALATFLPQIWREPETPRETGGEKKPAGTTRGPKRKPRKQGE